MTTLNVGGRDLHVTRIEAVKPGLEAAAFKRAEKNGADDVIFTIGTDTYHATGRGMKLGKIQPNDKVTLEGREGRVLAVDNQINTFMEGMTALPGLIVGGSIGAFGVAGFVQGMMAGANMAGIGLILASAGLALGLVINLVPAFYGALRKID